ncbi:MAG TPA: peptidoglycan DD-metalloendopeptidase family protein [Terriglobales bacterium]|jgi:murein DD-endopeptidase MepM/ murein hydrolase activator NlpD|nr:peptidoglycan DD-metalloendopeptidase family protein [Terriglobales bacterium]
MKGKSYTFFIASSASGGMRRLRVPFYVLNLLLVLAVVGGITILAGIGSYSRMLLKATNYNTLRREQDSLKQQYKQLQTEVKDTNQRLNSLQSLASEVAMAYGLNRFQQTPFAMTDVTEGTTAEFQQTLDQFSYLEKNASLVTVSNGGLRLMPSMQLSALGIVPTLWPVVGEITGHFGERLDPFSGEGAFHAGMDIASHYGDGIRASADGVVTVVDRRAGYGKLVVIDHGFGVTTWYGHLSNFNTQMGTHVKRGEVIGYEGASGRSTGPHLHYEVRIYNTPVNPWRYLRNIPTAVASAD